MRKLTSVMIGRKMNVNCKNGVILLVVFGNKEDACVYGCYDA